MEITTPLGDDVLLFHRMRARDELGRLSEYQLDLLSDARRHRPGQDPGPERHRETGAARRRAAPFQRLRDALRAGRHARPLPPLPRHGASLALVSHPHGRLPHLPGNDRPDIVDKVFDSHPHVADFKQELTSSYRKWEYCVQYRETDFNFVSRLMEEEGIYYYFRHTDGHHTLVLTDSASTHATFAGYETIVFISPGSRAAAGARAHQRLEPAAGNPAGPLCARRFRLRETERGAAGATPGLPQTRTGGLRSLRLSGRVPDGGRRRALRALAHRGAACAVRDGARGDQCARRLPRLICSISTGHTRGTRTPSTWWSRPGTLSNTTSTRRWRAPAPASSATSAP